MLGSIATGLFIHLRICSANPQGQVVPLILFVFYVDDCFLCTRSIAKVAFVWHTAINGLRGRVILEYLP